MRVNLAILLILLLAACAGNNKQFVDIPIPLHEHIKLPEKPYLSIFALKEYSSADEVMKAYVASIYALDSYCDALKTICQSE